MIDHPFFKKALPLFYALESAGYEAYFVGGAVRDFFLGRPVHDVDLATSATPEEVKKVFPHTVDVGIEHGTILVLLNGDGFEVTTFRTESAYSDFRRPDDVQFVRSIHDDLQRRDFTINAMAMTAGGDLLDPFNGQGDLLAGVIRTVGDASERFREDALRMMRAARFVSQLSFELDSNTMRSMKAHAPLLSYIAVERKLNEMDKLLAGPGKKNGLTVLLETGLFQFLPGLDGQKKLLEELSGLSLQLLETDQIWLLIADRASPGNPFAFLKEWRMPQKRIKRIEKGIRTLKRVRDEGFSDVLLYEAGLETAVDCAKALTVLEGETHPSGKKIASRWEALPIKNRQDLAVTGADLLDWAGKPRGIWIKECLELAERAVINSEIDNTKKKIKEFLQRAGFCKT